jgi:cardiolipin synthase C
VAAFDRFVADTTWCAIQFLSDQPGKPMDQPAIGASLGELIAAAKQQIVIQSPYLVVSKEVRALLSQALERRVRVRINTNSMASTDNLQAFSGYRNQRDDLLKMGVEVFEYRPDARSHRTMRSAEILWQVMTGERQPLFGLHAKTLVIDRSVTFIGTFNLDPRSQNLNTEVGVLIRDPTVSQAVHDAIETDMQPQNSWNALRDEPDQYASVGKRTKVRFWQWMPIESLL